MSHEHKGFVPHTHFSPGVYYLVKKPTLTWDGVGGYEDVKKILKEMVCLPLKKPDLIKEMNLEIPTGVLMWGPLGVGMKMLTEAAATEANATYVLVSGQEILGKPEELAKAFADAKEHAPSLLYISDIDWLAPRAGCDYEWDSTGDIRGKPPTFADKELTTCLIEEIDKLHGTEGVALMGSCYRADAVDQAVVKEKSRFNRKVFVHPPTVEDRMGILKLYIGRMGDIVEPNIDLQEIAEKTEGFVGWDIETLCKRAALNAVKENTKKVTQEHFLKGVGEVDPWLTPVMTEMYYTLRKNDCPHHYFF